MTTSNRVKAPLAVLLATVVSVSVLNAFKPGTEKKAPSKPPAIPVESQTIERENFQVVIPSQGIVEAATQATLAAQVSGNVIARSPNFERGGWFKKGEVLITVDDSDYMTALKLAEANQSKARVQLEEEQARSVSAIRDWKRQGYKKEPSDFVARRPQVAAAKAELDATDAAVLKAELDLSRTRITAPFDGRVIGNAVDLGNYVTPGIAVGNIVEAKKLKVALPVSADWRNMLDWSNDGVEAAIHLPASPSVSWQALIEKVSADISATTRQFSLIATIDLDSGGENTVSLLIGDYVSATIKGKIIPDVVVIPRGALYDGRFVWLIKSNKLYKRDVNVVWTDTDVAVIDQGLAAGELITITPVGSVVSGTEVKLLSAATESASLKAKSTFGSEEASQ